jgi:RNA polymerase sigma factor for flagellar operon FliA
LNSSDIPKEHVQLVKRVAYLMKSKLPPSVEVDDLIQAGMIGLLDAMRLYDASHDRKFEIYAVQRIRGSMLDELRRYDHLSRPHREQIEKGLAKDVKTVSFDEFYEEGGDLISQSDNPLDRLIKKDLLNHAVDFLEGLNDHQKQLMQMHYLDDVSLREISRSMGYSEAWACLQRGAILKGLSEALHGH